MYEAALAKIESMSDDDICEGMAATGIEFTHKHDEKIIRVSLHRNTARPDEYRKSIFARCREVLSDDDWAFSSSHGVYGKTNISTVVVAVWTEAHAAILKLAFGPEITVEVQSK